MKRVVHGDSFTSNNVNSLLGTSKNDDLGFACLSNYILEHPAMDAVKVYLLSLLLAHAESLKDLKAGFDSPSKVILRELVRKSGMGDKTVYRHLLRLEQLGLIKQQFGRRKDARFRVYVLKAGPWKPLGDLPERGHRFQDLFDDARAAFQRFEREIGDVFDDDEVYEWFEKNAMRSAKNPLGKSSLRQAKVSKKSVTQAKVSGQDDRCDAEISGQNDRCDYENDTQETMHIGQKRHLSQTEESLDLPSEIDKTQDENLLKSQNAYTIYTSNTNIVNKIRDIESVSETSSDASFDSNSFSSPKQNPATLESSEKPAQDKSSSAIFPTPISRRKPKKPPKPKVVSFEAKYRQLCEERFSSIIPRYGRKETAQLKNMTQRYDADFMLKMLDWVFENWLVLKQDDFFKDHLYPPLFLFTSNHFMDKHGGFVSAGKNLEKDMRWRKQNDRKAELDPEIQNSVAEMMRQEDAERRKAKGLEERVYD